MTTCRCKNMKDCLLVCFDLKKKKTFITTRFVFSWKDNTALVTGVKFRYEILIEWNFMLRIYERALLVRRGTGGQNQDGRLHERKLLGFSHRTRLNTILKDVCTNEISRSLKVGDFGTNMLRPAQRRSKLQISPSNNMFGNERGE